MAETFTARFDTRRDAEMTIERLVQEHGVDRSAIFVTTDGSANSAGSEQAGSDTAGTDPTPASRDDAALRGAILLTVDIDDPALAEAVTAAFDEFGANPAA